MCMHICTFHDDKYHIVAWTTTETNAATMLHYILVMLLLCNDITKKPTTTEIYACLNLAYLCCEQCQFLQLLLKT